jgi:hypothetical protein
MEENANLYEEAVNDQVCLSHDTVSLISYAEANIVAPNLIIWELDLQDILL